MGWTDLHPIKWTYQFLNCDTVLKYIRLMSIQH